MSAFESLFALFGLVLGLAIADILGCFARALDGRPRIRIGWLTPLLGLLVLLDLTTYWAVAWMFREALPPGLLTLFGALLFSSMYFLAAYRVFPGEVVDGADLDARFFEVRKFVLSILIFARVLQLIGVASIPAFAPSLRHPFTIATFVLVFVLYGLIMVVKNKVALIALLFAFILSWIVGPIIAQ